jgi:hypothetical protein
MGTREISDEEYAFLQGRKQVADFVEPIYKHPKWGKEAKRLIKQVYPNAEIPDYDIETKIETRLDEERKKRDDEKAAERQKAEHDAWQKKRAEVQKQYGFTPEGMQRLEDFMIENNVGNYDVAASHIVAREPKTSAPEYDAGYWHHDRQEGFKEIAKDPEAWARNEFLQAIFKDEQQARQQR